MHDFRRKLQFNQVSAFSLIELLVVMALVSVLLGIGISALTTLRTTNLLTSTRADFISNYDTIRNRARNSVLINPLSGGVSDPEDVFAELDRLRFYYMSLEDGNYGYGVCIETETGAISCDNNQGIWKRDDEVQIELRNCNSGAVLPNLLIFSLSTADVQFANYSEISFEVLSEVSECELTFTSAGSEIDLTINVLGNEKLVP